MADRALMVDGNALAGELSEVFSQEMTVARVACGGCGAVEQLVDLAVKNYAMPCTGSADDVTCTGQTRLASWYAQIKPGSDVRASYKMVDGKAKALTIDATSKSFGQPEQQK